jgi:transposase
LVKKIIAEFILEHSTDIILARVNISKPKLLKILTLLRTEMTKDVPGVFEGIVEVDETYVGGKWINKRKAVKLRKKSKRGRGNNKQPVFGILCRNGQIWAELIDGVEAKDLQPRIEKQVKKGAIVCSDTWRGYTGIATKGYVHRLVNHGKHEYSDGKGNHINGLEGFWGYLKRKLAARGGIRKSRLHLYLGEYVWRYNHKSLNLKEQENILYKLISGNIWSGN